MTSIIKIAPSVFISSLEFINMELKIDILTIQCNYFSLKYTFLWITAFQQRAQF